MPFPHRIFRIYSQPALLAGAVIVASLLCLQTLSGSLGHDEAYTLQPFASQPYERIITSYPAPNNHILHSLLVRCSVQLLGTETWSARFPALVAGILAAPLIFVLGRSLFLNPQTGLVASGGVRVFSLEESTGWHQPATQNAHNVRLTAGTPATSGAPSLHLENYARTPFQLYSTTRFDVPTEGIAILAFARTRENSYRSIYSVSNNTELERPHLLKTAAWPTPVLGNDGKKWLLEAYLLLVKPQVAYGLYIPGVDDEEQNFAEITCFYFPY